MRKTLIDNYETIALIGNNSYDIKFMNYLFDSQGIKSVYDSIYEVADLEKDETLKKIAHYFGSQVPILIDNNGLRTLFKKYKVNESTTPPGLSSTDIINQINFCLESDAVYVCNSCGVISKDLSFMLGYLMAKKQEIFFWEDIDESEWLMSTITKNNEHGWKETIVFPLEIIRALAFPYLFNKDNNAEKISVERNTTFNINVAEDNEIIPNTVVLLGSLRKQLDSIKDQAANYQKRGYTVLAPKISNVKKDTNGFIIFEDDESEEPVIIEKDFLEKCLKAEDVVICNSNGYLGNTVMMEIGYLLGKGKKISFIEQPTENWVTDTVDYLEKSTDAFVKKKI